MFHQMNSPRSAMPLLLAFWAVIAGCRSTPDPHVGPLETGEHLTSTYQWLRPAGKQLEFAGRPVDLLLSPNGRTLYVKDNRGLAIIDAERWEVLQELKLTAGGGSTHGLAMTPDGSRLFVSSAQDALWEAIIDSDGKAAWGRKVALPGPRATGNSHVGGIALAANGKTALVCLSRNNALGIIDLEAMKLTRQIPVGVAPYDVALDPDGKTAYVSNWGGRRAREGDKTAQSSGTAAVVDERGVAASGTVSIVDLEKSMEIMQIPTGLHPSDLELAPRQQTLYVANANSDSVSVIDTSARKVIETIAVHPDDSLLFGSAPNALALSRDGARLYVANGGNNAVAVVNVEKRGRSSVVGFIPTAWYPGALAVGGHSIFVANVKGVGSRNLAEKKTGWNSHYYRGSVSKIDSPSAAALASFTKQVKTDAHIPEKLRALPKTRSLANPLPVPKRPGDPSVFEHVVYIIKENRTYDQILGDVPRGNGDPALCVFGQKITPNHHALAEQFVLLDNYYCNGVLSADGHAWAMEGYATDYLEKSFGGFTRSYPFSGDDPVSFAPTGFIWDNALLHGLSFRNYGEMSKTTVLATNATFKAIYDDHAAKSGKFRFRHDIQIEMLRRYSCSNSPGWNLKIPDVIRADVFLNEFAEFEIRGDWPNLVIIFLPSDHTSGTTPGNPTPRAQVADNDLAVGRIVERISRSSFWPKTCIFAIEDDPQAGFDHVDGHRSLCLVASPYTRRGAVVSRFYNQTSVLHTMERMLGLPPMNQMDARAPLMTECFTPVPDMTPYTCQTNRIALDELNKPKTALRGAELYWANQSLEQSFDEVDQADENTLNRILWHSVKGADTPYPVHFAGAHGRGLKSLHLRLNGEKDDDDD